MQKLKNTTNTKNSKIITAIILALIVVTGAVFSLLNTINKTALSTHYAFSNWGVEGYETVIFKRDNATQTGDLDEVWLYLTFNCTNTNEENIKIYFKYASTLNGYYYSVARSEYLTIKNETASASKWYCFSNLELSNSYDYFEIATNTAITIGEVVFVSELNNLISVRVENAGLATNFSEISQYKHSDSYGDESKTIKASALCDEQNKFNYANVIENEDLVKEYKTDGAERFSTQEASIVSSVINLLNNEAFSSYELNPLGYELISLGVLIFGANTLGARIVPLIFMLLMLCLLYFLGKLIFKNSNYGLALAFLGLVSGILFSTSTFVNGEVMFAFFALLSLYFAIRFYTYGINDRHKIKSYVYLGLIGLFFGLALGISIRAIIMLIPILAVYVFGVFRQYDAYKNRKQNLTDSAKINQNKQNYKNKLSLTLSVFIFTIILLPIIILFIGASISYKSLQLTYAGAGGGVIGLSFKHLFNYFSITNSSLYAVENSYSPMLFIFNYGAQTLSSGKYVYMTALFTILGLLALLFVGVNLIASYFSKDKQYENIKPYKKVLSMVFITYIVSYLFNAFIPTMGISAYLVPSLINCIIILYAFKMYNELDSKTTFTIKGLQINKVKIVSAILLLLLLVNFGLSMASYIGVNCSLSLYSWNIFGRGIVG